jgi:hypothetical protein
LDHEAYFIVGQLWKLNVKPQIQIALRVLVKRQQFAGNCFVGVRSGHAFAGDASNQLRRNLLVETLSEVAAIEGRNLDRLELKGVQKTYLHGQY